jgi:APA family basic amino acid/polyamine antiporter
MGHYRQLPERLRRVHPRFRTPYVSILIFSGAAIITLIPGQAELLATLYSFGAMLSFTIAHVSLIRLRQKYPNKAREWKPRFVDIKIKGVAIPMTAVLGGLGTFSAWLVVIALNPRTLVIGLGWMVVGFAIFVFYRRSQGLSLTRTEEMQMPESLGVEDVEYESVMLVLEDKPGFPRKTVETAISLASRRRRGIHVLAFVTVPKHLPIDDTLDDTLAAEIEAAQSKVEQAKLIGGSKVSGQVQPIRPDEAGQTAIREALKVKATALVVELRYRGGRPLIGPDLQKILAQRPCRVVVVGDPEAEREAPAAALRHDLEVV